MSFKPTEWVLGWPRIAEAVTQATDAYVSDRWLRELAKRFRWKAWIVLKPQTNKDDGKPYGKPINQTVVQSAVAAFTSAQAVIKAEEPFNKARGGIESGVSRRAASTTTVSAGAAVMNATVAVAKED
jgi:hypothetical protein